MAKDIVRFEVDDKKLKQIIKNVVDQDVHRYEIRDGVEYGIFQELGFTHWITGEWIQNPFLIPSFENETKDLAREIGEVIESGGSLDDLFNVVAHNILAGAIMNAPRTPQSARSPWTKRTKVTGALKNSLTIDRK